MLDPELLRQLELLSLDSLASVMSVLEGEHPGAVRARFAELSDYRGYQPGDDPRLIDWNAYARLDELVVRTSAAHEGLLLTLLVDCSRSMAWPGSDGSGNSGGVTKLRYAQRLAAAFGAVALLHSDAVRVCALADGTARLSATLTGRGALGRLLDELERLPGGRGTDLAGSLRACRGGGPGAGAGVAVLLSDLLVPGEQDEALGLLGPAGTVMHVVDPGDADPFPGMVAGRTVELRDSETGEIVVADVTPALRRRYAERFAARCAELSARCAADGVRYVLSDTSTPVADHLFGGGALTGSRPRPLREPAESVFRGLLAPAGGALSRGFRPVEGCFDRLANLPEAPLARVE